MTVTGVVYKIFPTIKRKTGFLIRDLIVAVNFNSRNDELIKFQCIQHMCSYLDLLTEGDMIDINFFIRGREIDSKINEGEKFFINTLEIVSIENLSPSEKKESDDILNKDEDDDELPF